MAMTVITITNAPMSLRGDLTKWMQEIATGVYIGNLSSRVREELWERVIQSVGRGQATISYATNNELGYQFATHRTKQTNVSFDGIPLVMIPREESHLADNLKSGFSNQSKFRRARKYAVRRRREPTPIKRQTPNTPYIVLDIETDGIDPSKNNIIEIAALRVDSSDTEEFHCLIRNEHELPDEIVKLTGITDQILASEGRDIAEVLSDFMQFIQDLPLVGYNVHFDIDFINQELHRINKNAINNRKIDLLGLVKKEKMFLKSYKLADVLPVYGIVEEVKHRALQDACLTYILSTKVNGFRSLLDRKSR